jgi:hypothetical protein
MRFKDRRSNAASAVGLQEHLAVARQFTDAAIGTYVSLGIPRKRMQDVKVVTSDLGVTDVEGECRRGTGIVYADYCDGVIRFRSPLLGNYMRVLERESIDSYVGPTGRQYSELLDVLRFMITDAAAHEIAHHIKGISYSSACTSLRQQKPKIIVDEAVATFAGNTVLTAMGFSDSLMERCIRAENKKFLTDSAKLLESGRQSREAVTELFINLGYLLGYTAFLETLRRDKGSLPAVMRDALSETSGKKNIMLLASMAYRHPSFNEFLLNRRTSCNDMREMLRRLEPT